MDTISTSRLSKRIQTLSLSPTLALTAAAKTLQAKGVDIIGLTCGEPDIMPPAEILQALADVASHPEACAYTAPGGLLELRKTISLWLKAQRDLNYPSDQILVTPGCKMALFQSLFSLLDPHDEVLFGAPYWVSYPEMTLACGGIPIAVPTLEKENFLITSSALKPYLSSRSKVLILNSPHNPTGQYHSRADLKSLAALLKEHPQILILCDDIYDALMPHKPVHLLHVAPELITRTIVINGLSKSFGLTGWRLGFAAGPGDVIAAMTKIQSQTTTCVSAPIQYAAIRAYQYQNQEAFFLKSAQTYSLRAAAFLKALAPLKKMRCLPLAASFYIWADIQDLIEQEGLEDDKAFAQDLLSTARVAAVPGSAFGTPGYLRLSLTVSIEALCEAARRIVERYLK